MPSPVLRPRVVFGRGPRSPQHPPPANALPDYRPTGSISSKDPHAHLPGRHDSHLGVPRALRDGAWVFQVPLGFRHPAAHKSPSLTYHPHVRPAASASVPLLRKQPFSKWSRWAPSRAQPICYTHLSPRPPSFAIVHPGRPARFQSFPPSSISPWPSVGFFEVRFRDSGRQPFSKSLASHNEPCKPTSLLTLLVHIGGPVQGLGNIAPSVVVAE